ncbi:pilus assembly protein PilM [Methanolobus sp.]|uniref:pilus assembly protein PilM n=1 Tax=Methanolobus sp. TaxID=1874737 RepID=UPI0025E07B4B|nr:pilus assembly protein PilM [Methanolobus sp.]
MSNSHFALDIGTRTVVGLIVEGEPLEVKAACICEHEERSMHDGQIHDVDKVAEVVRKVKTELEKEIGYKLTRACVAVAGRALRTSKAKVSIDLPYREISDNDVSEIEFEALARASAEIDSGERFNCVGYSVIGYELDGQRISNIKGHSGSSISIEVLATFLPEAVVNSMFAVLARCDMEVSSITLEPIAALSVAIPLDMRKLNIALVDIGAGTSDIAVTNDGTVIGYGMVAEAGDEITDFICDHYLVDFKKGEEIKQRISACDIIEMQDFFGNVTSIKTTEIISVVGSEIDKLALHIADEILAINGKPPRAVVLVGGGSQTVMLKERLSVHLGVPVQRIGARLPAMIETFRDNTSKVTGADMITPLGIALTAIRKTGIEFTDLTVNNTPVHLMALNGLSVMDALVATHIKRLYPRPGLALTLKVNSQFITIEGDAGKHATVLLDGKKANLGDPVRKGSRIEFEPPSDGRGASITVRELISKMEMDLFTDVTVNDEATRQMISVLVNGKIVPPEENVPDRAEVIIEPATLEEVLHRTGNDVTDKIQVTVNRRPKLLDRTQLLIRLNGTAVKSADLSNIIIKSGDKVQICKNEAIWTVADIFDMPASRKSTSVILNGEKVTFNGHDNSVIVNGRKAELSERVFDGDDITIKEGPDENPILSDLFEFMDINREELVGKNIKLFVNGTPARFTTPLREGNKVSIEFQEV